MPLILNLIRRRGREGKYYVLKRALHLTADGQVVEETDPAGVTVLGGAGSPVSEEDAKKYGLDESHLESEPDLAALAPLALAALSPPEAPAEQAAAAEPESVSDELPEDFPGIAALNEAGIHTYAQVRATENLIEINGIGPVTVEKIAERLSEKG